MNQNSSRWLASLFALIVCMFALRSGVNGAQYVSIESQTAPIQSLIVENTSWAQMGDACLTLTISLTNTGNQAIQQFEVLVLYKNKTGGLVGGRGHLVMESVEPGQTKQFTLPEYSPPGDDGSPVITVKPIATNG